MLSCHARSIPAEDPFHRAYELREPLGAGGAGAVFRAIQRSTGRPVAIKFLLHPTSPDAPRRFRLETEALAKLAHAHVLALYDAGTAGGQPYLVTELLPGGTLRDRLTPGERVDARTATAIVAQVLEGLAACHQRGFLHRDLKPENIMFDGDGLVKLADLGLAKAGDAGVTQDGEIPGTPLYMAPELLLGETATQASDLFAVGLVLHELVFGFVPLAGDTIPELIGRRCAGRLSLPQHALPPQVARLLVRLLANDPAARPASASEALRLLTAPLAASGALRTSGRLARPRVSVPAPRRSGALRAVATGLALVVASLAAGWQARALVSPAASAPRPAAPPRA